MGRGVWGARRRRRLEVPNVEAKTRPGRDDSLRCGFEGQEP